MIIIVFNIFFVKGVFALKLNIRTALGILTRYVCSLVNCMFLYLYQLPFSFVSFKSSSSVVQFTV